MFNIHSQIQIAANKINNVACIVIWQPHTDECDDYLLRTTVHFIDIITGWLLKQQSDASSHRWQRKQTHCISLVSLSISKPPCDFLFRSLKCHWIVITSYLWTSQSREWLALSKCCQGDRVNHLQWLLLPPATHWVLHKSLCNLSTGCERRAALWLKRQGCHHKELPVCRQAAGVQAAPDTKHTCWTVGAMMWFSQVTLWARKRLLSGWTSLPPPSSSLVICKWDKSAFASRKQWVVFMV